MFFFFNFLKFFFPVWLEKHFKILMVWMEVFEIICLRLNSSAAYNRFFFYVTEGLNVSKHDRDGSIRDHFPSS